METEPLSRKPLSALWTKLCGTKQNLIRRCEQYGRYTLPYLCPADNVKDSELQGSLSNIGARGVNHLANKLSLALFKPEGQIFRLQVTDDGIDQIKQDADNGDQDAIEFMQSLDRSLVEAEMRVMRRLNHNKFRTEAITALKSLIVTGNALVYYPEDNSPVQVYLIKDYCVQRDLSGKVVLILLRDEKSLYTFDKDVIEKLRMNNKHKYNKGDCNVKLFTEVRLGEDGKYHIRQMADDVELDSYGSYPADQLPWIPLTWNLVRGEDYGRGLVEDHAGAFHTLDILTRAYTEATAVAADIKWLVSPQSLVDVKELNDSRSGSYHVGQEGDVTAIQLNKMMDLQTVYTLMDSLTRDLAQVFLLNSAVTRDAERVTAEEIRANIQELETSHGGIYSRLADEWQRPLIMMLLAEEKITIGDNLDFRIITGIESLSRAGDLDNIRLWIGDLALLQAVPEEFRGSIDPRKFAEYLAIRRGVDTGTILKSNEQIQAEQQAAMQQQADMLGQQVEAEVAVEAGKEAVKE